MTEAVALELRHVRLAEAVTLRPSPLGSTPDDGSEGVFVALDDSPPVRTVVAVVEGERRRALEVVSVVEVPASDEPGGSAVRGFYGRWVGDEALGRAMKVGTEHLEDGTPVVQPVVYDNSAVIEVSDTVMAMPAPVIVLDDESGAVDADDEEREPSDSVPADTAEHGETVSYPDNIYAAETVTYPEYAVAEAQLAAQAADRAISGDGEGTSESGEAEAASESGEAASESGEAASEAGEAAAEAGEAASEAGEAAAESGEAAADEAGDAGESRSKGRKKRGRKRR